MNTIQPYQLQRITEFNKQGLTLLKPYFDINFTKQSKTLWFENLLQLAFQDLGMAHCLQHNATARYLVQNSFVEMPDFFQVDFDQVIGCYSSAKQMDTMKLENNVVTGKKHWVSNLHVADFGVMRVTTGTTESFVLIDFHQHTPEVSFECDQIGLELARPGTLDLKRYEIPEGYYLGQRDFADNDNPFVYALSFHDYCFITNYLGCIIGLYHDIEIQAQKRNFGISSDLARFKLAISNLKMLWEDNLASIDSVKIDDKFWHRRNTQYTQSKTVLIDLVGLALRVADSSWMMSRGSHNQKFRDALVFSAHMQPLCKALETKHFVAF